MPKLRKVQADDLFRFKLPESPAISPDGERIVHALRRMDRKENRYFANLYLVPIGGGRRRRLTRGDQLDTGPVWSPDGKRIAFVSTREKKTGIWTIEPDGGEAAPLLTIEGSISELQFSPDGKEILYLQRNKKKEKPEDRARRATFKHIKHLRHKLDGFGYFDDEKTQLWACSARSGSARQITRGDYDITCPRWSPDGRKIAYLAHTDPEMGHEGWRTQAYVISSRGGRARQVTDGDGYRAFLAWAPEGKSLLIPCHFGGPGEWIMHPYQIWEFDLATGDGLNLTPWMDNWPFNFVLSDTVMGEASLLSFYRDGEQLRIAFVQNQEGGCKVMSMARDGSEVRDELAGKTSAYGVSVNAEGRAAVLATTMMDMGDLYSLRLDGSGKARRLTQVNRAYLASRDLPEPEEFHFKSGKGKVHGWILKPPGFRKDRKYPGLLQIHGGPMGQYGYVFFHEMQMLAARGYVVAFSNPRGSCGYGTKWMSCIRGKWGGKDYDDLMAVTDALARKPYVDGRRLGVLGGSYGGFMTTWILGHNKRFKTGITMRQAGNRWTQFNSCDYGVTEYHSFKAWPWEKPMAYLKQSPNWYAHRIKAPLLIIHSEQDLRCPITQADELFTIVKSQGRVCEYIRFEDESHGLSRGGKPLNRLERLDRINDWLRRYL